MIINNNSFKLEESINLPHLYIENNKILLYEVELEIPKIKENFFEFTDDDNINPEKYSDYFYDYFEYENKYEGGIKYQNNKIREEITRNLNTL